MTLQGLSPLAIVLPHPALPPRTTTKSKSRSSIADPEPHTPRSCHSSLSLIYYPANRKSSDSWNSSNAEDIEVEWKHEELLLLSRTLDALPSHLLTPFNGPIPPSNLLDKIARGVSQAKGPIDWPHSIRSTRVKLLELARGRANDERVTALVIEEDERDEMSVDVLPKKKKTTTTTKENVVNLSPNKSRQPRAPRPLYRQSSMDFINPGQPEDTDRIRGNKAIARLSNRLQRPDRLFPNKAYQHQHQHFHPYSRPPPPIATTPSRSPLSSLYHATTTTTSSTSTSSSNSSSGGGVGGSRPTSTISSTSSPPPIATDDVPSLTNGSSGSSSNSSSTCSTPYSTLTRSSAAGVVRGIITEAEPLDFDVGLGLGMKGVSRHRLPQSLSQQQQQMPTTPRQVLRIGLKRAPGYGAAARQDVGHGSGRRGEENKQHVRNVSGGSYPSSDEEEKVRSVRVKKMRVGSLGGSGVEAPNNAAAAATARVKPREKQKGVDAGERVRLGGLGSPSSVPLVEGASAKPRTTRTAAKSDMTRTSLASSPISPRSSKVPVKTNPDGKEKIIITSLTTTTATTATPGSPPKAGTKMKEKTSKTKTQTTKPILPMNLERNPSMFGEELPPYSSSVLPPHRGGVVEPFSNPSGGVGVGVGVPPPVPPKDDVVHIRSPKGVKKSSRSHQSNSASPSSVPVSEASMMTVATATALPTPTTLISPTLSHTTDLDVMDVDIDSPTSPVPMSPTTTSPCAPMTAVGSSGPGPGPDSGSGSSSSPVVRTLRRVRMRRLVPSRRISFGSITVPPDADVVEEGSVVVGVAAAPAPATATTTTTGSGNGRNLRVRLGGLGDSECLGSAIQLA